MNGTGKTGRAATEHSEVPADGLCMQRCQGGAGKRAAHLKNVFKAVKPLIITFLPHGGETAHSKNVQCRPNATGTNQSRNKQNTCTQQIRLRKRLLQRQGTNAEQTDQEGTNTTAHQQNHCSGHDVTINRRHARRQTQNWPDMHGPVRERRPTGWRHLGEPRPITLSHPVRSGGWESVISANGGLPAHRYTPQVTPRWPRGSEPASPPFSERCIRSET